MTRVFKSWDLSVRPAEVETDFRRTRTSIMDVRSGGSEREGWSQGGSHMSAPLFRLEDGASGPLWGRPTGVESFSRFRPMPGRLRSDNGWGPGGEAGPGDTPRTAGGPSRVLLGAGASAGGAGTLYEIGAEEEGVASRTEGGGPSSGAHESGDFPSHGEGGRRQRRSPATLTSDVDPDWRLPVECSVPGEVSGVTGVRVGQFRFKGSAGPMSMVNITPTALLGRRWVGTRAWLALPWLAVPWNHCSHLVKGG